MKDNGRSLPLKNAPLQYAPNGEIGVVYLFANIAKKLQFRIEEIRAAYATFRHFFPFPLSRPRTFRGLHQSGVGLLSL
jgi:hypothetical protein